MNMWITAAPTTSPSAAHAIRQRLMNPPKVARIAPPEPEPVVKNVGPIISTYRCQQPKDAHVRSWEWHKAQEACKVNSHIRRRCEQLGVSVEDVKGSRRFRRIIVVRQTLMWEIKKLVQPSISLPELGRIFGGRDHTTCLHAVRKIEAERSKGVTAAMIAEMKLLFANGMTKKEISRTVAVSETTVNRYVDPVDHARQVERERLAKAAKKARAV